MAWTCNMIRSKANLTYEIRIKKGPDLIFVHISGQLWLHVHMLLELCFNCLWSDTLIWISNLNFSLAVIKKYISFFVKASSHSNTYDMLYAYLNQIWKKWTVRFSRRFCFCSLGLAFVYNILMRVLLLTLSDLI